MNVGATETALYLTGDSVISGADFELHKGRLHIYASEDLEFSADETPDVLVAIQAWIENLAKQDRTDQETSAHA